MNNKKNSNLTDKKNLNIDLLFKIEDSGIYDIEINSTLMNQYAIEESSGQLEVTATTNFCIQRFKCLSIEFIRYRRNNTWTDWEKVMSLDNPVITTNNGVTAYDNNNILNELQLYINKVRKDSSRSIYSGKQPLYDDSELRRAISKMVPISREPEIVPVVNDKRDTVSIKNKDWLRLDRLDAGESSGIAVSKTASYVFDNNINNKYNIISESDKYSVIGDEKFDRIFIEGHFRPYATHSSYAEKIPERRSANFMVQWDLEWKWVYNGGRVPEVNVGGNPVSEMYYKCTPDFGYGWPQCGTTGSQTLGMNPTTTIFTNTHPIGAGPNGRIFTNAGNPNIEYALWR